MARPALRLASALAILAPLAAVPALAADAIVYDEVAPSAAAPAPSEFDISFSLTGATDYRFRGISQSDRDPAMQGTIEATYSLLYAGAFISNVEFGTPSPDVEVDVFAGIRPELYGIGFDFGVVGYLYPDATELNFLEIYGAASYDFETFALGGSVYYSPDFGNTGLDGTYVEAEASIPLPLDFSLSGAIGHQSFESGFAIDDYLTWNVGLSYAFTDNVTFDLRYVDTDLNEGLFCPGPFQCGSTIVGSMTVASSLSELRSRFR